MQKNNFSTSFWEYSSFLKGYDLIIVGSGIVGLNAAITFKKKHPKSGVLIIERGAIPMGASTKNAGFACFGSPSELISDLSAMDEKTVLETIEMRWKGLKRLRKLIGDHNLDFVQNGGFEVFDSKKKFTEAADYLSLLNLKLSPITKSKHTFKINNKKLQLFGLSGFHGLIESPMEGQLDPGKMMRDLMEMAAKKGITTWNETVDSIEQLSDGVSVKLSNSFEIRTRNLIIATNGFARQLIPDLPVVPARTQVLITSPIRNLKLRGVFHYDEGFFYFRNVGNRVLLGGGRNMDIKGEETDEFGITLTIQKRLEKMLSLQILSEKNYTIDYRWSGIMGMGKEKKPIIKHTSKNVVVAVRMGGMGVAIGSLVGEMAANEI